MECGQDRKYDRPDSDEHRMLLQLEPLRSKCSWPSGMVSLCKCKGCLCAKPISRVWSCSSQLQLHHVDEYSTQFFILNSLYDFTYTKYSKSISGNSGGYTDKFTSEVPCL